MGDGDPHRSCLQGTWESWLPRPGHCSLWSMQDLGALVVRVCRLMRGGADSKPQEEVMMKTG